MLINIDYFLYKNSCLLSRDTLDIKEDYQHIINNIYYQLDQLKKLFKKMI